MDHTHMSLYNLYTRVRWSRHVVVNNGTCSAVNSLVGGIPTPLKNMSQVCWSFTTYGKIKFMFQSPPTSYLLMVPAGKIPNRQGLQYRFQTITFDHSYASNQGGGSKHGFKTFKKKDLNNNPSPRLRPQNEDHFAVHVGRFCIIPLRAKG